jgi:hypothetical protein
VASFLSAMHESQMTPTTTITAAAISSSGRAAMLTANPGPLLLARVWGLLLFVGSSILLRGVRAA